LHIKKSGTVHWAGNAFLNQFPENIKSIIPAQVKHYENSERIVARKYFPTLVEGSVKKAEPTAIMTLPYYT
jgi:hypothetical protein